MANNKLKESVIKKIQMAKLLFDLGADAAGLLFPGGSIVIKAAKKYIDNSEDLIVSDCDHYFDGTNLYKTIFVFKLETKLLF